MTPHAAADIPSASCTHPVETHLAASIGNEEDLFWTNLDASQFASNGRATVVSTCHVGAFHAVIGQITALRYTALLQDDLSEIPSGAVHPMTAGAHLCVAKANRSGRQWSSVHLYTDGSHAAPNSKRIAAGGWAFVALGADTQGEIFLLGWQAAASCFDQELVNECGGRTNNVAEGLAMIWALMYIFSLPGDFNVEIHSDSMYILGILLREALLDAAVVLPIAPAELSFCCYECGQHFAAAKPLAMHCRMFHAARSPLLIAVHDTTHCLACLSEFHELSRLIQHLRAMTRCYESIVQHAPRPPGIDLEVLRQPSRLALKATKSGLARPLVVRLPFVKLAGPLPHWALL